LKHKSNNILRRRQTIKPGYWGGNYTIREVGPEIKHRSHDPYQPPIYQVGP